MSPNRLRGLAIMLFLGASALAGPGFAMCSSEGASVVVPKGYSVSAVDYQQVLDLPVRATLWSQRLGPRTTDVTREALPRGVWTPAAYQDQAQFQADHKSWKMGVSAIYADSDSDYSKSFDCVLQELHANGANPYGWYLLSYVPHERDVGQVAFLVRIQLQKGRLRPPPKPSHKGRKGK